MRKHNKLLALIAVIIAVMFTFTSCAPVVKLGQFIFDMARLSDNSEPDNPTVTDVRLEDDFYDYVNADWINESHIGSGVPAIDGFSEAASQTTTYLLYTIMGLADNREILPANSDEQKLADFYLSSVDYESRDKDGIAPIKPYLDAIEASENLDELTDVMIKMDNDGFGTFIMWNVSADWYDSRVNTLYISTGHIGLPLMEYYADNGAFDDVQEEYVDYLSDLFKCTDTYKDNAKDYAQQVFELEKELASSFLTVEETKNIDIQYNEKSFNEVCALAPNFDVAKFFKQTGIDKADKYIITCPKYFTKLNEIFVPENFDVLKKYVASKILIQSDYYLTRDMQNRHIEFNNYLRGINGQLEDIEIAYNTIDDYLGELLSKIYIESVFSDAQQVKADITEMTEIIIEVYEKRITALDWMSEETKEAAIEKLHGMNAKIGYPDVWTDYSGLEIKNYADGGSLLQNYINIYRYSCGDTLSKINADVNKDEWGMTAHTVNAYYDNTANEIVIPAGILMQPFYDSEASFEQNLGGIGFVIAHEVSHAFDDTGARFDKNGNINNWWSDEDYKAYQSKTAELEEFYDQIEVLDGEYIDGYLTLGENIADLTAINCITQACREYGSGDYETLYTAFASAWRSKCTDEYLSYSLKNDSHSPDKYRVNVQLMNVDEFYKTFDIEETDGMYLPENKRIKIW